MVIKRTLLEIKDAKVVVEKEGEEGKEEHCDTALMLSCNPRHICSGIFALILLPLQYTQKIESFIY